MVFTKCNIRAGSVNNYFGNNGANHTQLLIDSCELAGELFIDKGSFATLRNSTVFGRVVLQQTSRANIYNNFLTNMLQLISSSGWAQTPMQIYNNVILAGSYQGTVAYGFVTNSSTYFNFYHNTIYMNTPSMTGYALNITPSFGVVNVKNNIVYRYDSNTSNYIFRYPNIESYVGYINSDHNLFYRNGTSFSNNYTSLAAFTAGTGLDSNSVYADPMFGTVNVMNANSYMATSNILNTFTTSLSEVTTDINGNPRNPNHPTAGAFEMDSPPTAMTPSQSLQVCAGSDTTLHANFISNTSLTYAWYKNDTLITNANNSTLSFTNVQATDSGNYYCVATNNLGSDTATFSFDVWQAPLASIASVQGLNAACEGDSVLLTGNDQGGVWSNLSTNTQLYVTQSGNYFITNSNQCGVAVSNMVYVLIHPLPVPSITYQDTMLVCTPVGLYYQWYLNNAPVLGNSNTLLTSVDGVYSVMVVDSNGCSGTSASFNLVTTQIKNNSYEAEITIYPNPASSELTVQMSSTNQVIKVFDVLGNELQLPTQIQNNQYKLNIQELNKGMYFLKTNKGSVKFWKE
jgi:predicted GNAT family N-acyltransferase